MSNSSDRVLYDLKDGVARLTIHRPEKLNALDRETVQALGRHLERAGGDAAVGVVIVTGAGDKAFVAGADIGELAAQTPVEGASYARAGQEVFTRLERLGKPSIAAINGYALGGGLELALACTLRVAAEGARLGLPETGLAIIPGYGGTQRLGRLVGRGKALEMILTGEPIDATEAHRIGLVNRVVPAHDLLSSAESLARTLLGRGPVALRCAMQAILDGLDTPLQQGLGLEATLFGLTCATEDMREGTRAFLDKRKPVYKGR
jgi:enoyl-CoA hydratase